jgi:hypothetical protein
MSSHNNDLSEILGRLEDAGQKQKQHVQSSKAISKVNKVASSNVKGATASGKPVKGGVASGSLDNFVNMGLGKRVKAQTSVSAMGKYPGQSSQGTGSFTMMR